MKISFPLLLASSLLTITGCDKKPTVDVTIPPVTETKTLETRRLGDTINDYVASPTAGHEADVRKAFAELDGEIGELRTRMVETTGSDQAEAQAKLGNLTVYREQEMARFEKARLTSGLPATTGAVDARSGADKIGSTLDKVGGNIEEGAKKAGDSLEKAGEKVKDAATGNH